ncbi:MAG: hypothetical protein RLZZ480_146 [Candidatus Parcubacteria bacterium]|jgi:hypothetical protein
MNVLVKIIAGAAAIAGAQGLLGMDKAFAAESPRTVAVFQDLDGIPCKVVTGDRVYCHIRGVWQERVTASRQVVRPVKRSIGRSPVMAPTKTRPVASANVSAVARAAQVAAFDFEFAEYM